MKRFSLSLILFLFMSCQKANTLSPYTTIYQNGIEKNIILNNLVTFSVPSDIDYLDKCNPENEYINNYEKINVYAYAINQSEIEYMNPNVFEPTFLDYMKKNNFLIDISTISQLIGNNGTETLLYRNDKKKSVSGTYSVYNYKGLNIGETQWYSSKLDAVFICPLIEFHFYFVITDYLVNVKIIYSNTKDNSICQAFPEYFVKNDKGYSWKSEEARTVFFKDILNDIKKENPTVINSIIRLSESILHTINIIE